MEAEVAAQIGAGRYERTDERSTQRNGYRPRPWDTRVGTLELQIPKLRQGSRVEKSSRRARYHSSRRRIP